MNEYTVTPVAGKFRLSGPAGSWDFRHDWWAEWVRAQLQDQRDRGVPLKSDSWIFKEVTGCCHRCGNPCVPRGAWCNPCFKIVTDGYSNPPPFGGNHPVEIRFPVELHVGFLCITETPEQLQRLRNEPVE